MCTLLKVGVLLSKFDCLPVISNIINIALYTPSALRLKINVTYIVLSTVKETFLALTLF